MKIKLVVSALLAFLVIVFVTQNTEVAQVTFLLWSVEISLVLLVFIMLWVGIIIGWLTNSYLRFSRTRKRQLAKQSPVASGPARQQVEQAPQGEEPPIVEEEKQGV